MFGLLNLNKPPGLTSRDVVNRVQRVIHPVKVGHAGTLDPIATGVLVLCLGPATRLIEQVQRMPKRYRATFRLGQHSPSDDVELPVKMLSNAPVPSISELEELLPEFIGNIQQVPPAYSAINVKGKKAYDLARSGKPPELAARTITINSLEVIRYEYPELVLDVRCGSGTYIRSLGRDLAIRLGTAAVMSELERTEIGGFHVEDGVVPHALTQEKIEASLLNPRLAVTELPRIILDAQGVNEIRFGRFVTLSENEQAQHTLNNGLLVEELAAFSPEGELVAIMKPRGKNQLQTARNFVALN